MTSKPFEQHDAGLTASAAAVTVLTLKNPSTAAAILRAKLADYAVLGKVRISVLVLLVTAIGFCLASKGPVDLGLLFHTLLGTALVAFAANALNQVLERDFDQLMRRTADRPIPAGRIAASEATLVGVASGIIGFAQLLLWAGALAAGLAAATLLLYLFAYTPAKRLTAYNTWIGAVPGAIPPLIGYAAACGSLDGLGWMLFAILFVWQLPHFFAIAWMYRRDYAAGGFRMLSVVDPSGAATKRQTVALCVVLLAVSLMPALAGYVGTTALIGAGILGLGLLAVGAHMSRRLSDASARRMLWASVIHLPALMMLLLLDRM
jgi:protoheme IX farnesyltransferase